jgi:sugar-specific transcriptional regulator TrmB
VSDLGRSLLLSGVNGLNGNTVEKALHNFGLTKKETQIYIFLAKHKAQGGREIASGTKTSKAVVYRKLKTLQRKGFVESSLEYPVRYSAIPFETILDTNIRAKHEEARQMENSKRKLLTDWNKISIGEPRYRLEKFAVIEGDSKIFAKIFKMVRETKSQLSTVASVTGLIHADRYGIFEAIHNHPLRSRVKFRIITDLSTSNLRSARFLKRRLKRSVDFRGRNPDLGLRLSPRMIIRDQEEVLFFITPRGNQASRQKDETCLWTNCKALVDSFNVVFEDLWRNSTDLEQKIVEIETGKPTQNTHVIIDAETASKKYDKLLRSAEKEIVFVTSAEGLLAHWAKMKRLKEWAARGISVRILAPINSENLQAVHELSKCAAIRHLPDSYLETTVIDEKHLFQFKNQPPKEKKRGEGPYFENAFYTNDREYVEKTKKMLNGFWRNARAPPTVTLESVLRPSPLKVAPISGKERPHDSYKKLTGFREEISEMLTAEDILKKTIGAKKFPAKNWPKDIMRYYGSCVMAIIHPVKQLNIPNTMIAAWHFDKQSSFGAQDTIRFFLWLETEKSHAYVPVALITDNPKSAEFQKEITAGLPLARNVQVANKDEVQVRVHGNSGFAAWTVPIPLPPSRYALPPACTLVEGYSTIKTIGTKHVLPCGVNIIIEINRYDGFVTFFHPSSKYTGPGTDGAVGRDVVLTEYPPARR